jgi:hypothetical protein
MVPSSGDTEVGTRAPESNSPETYQSLWRLLAFIELALRATRSLNLFQHEMKRVVLLVRT